MLASKLGTLIATISSQPLVPREDCAKMFQTQFVGVAAGQMTFALLDAPVLRRGLQSEIFMAIMPIDASIKVMKEFGAEGDVAKIAARAMDMNANLLDALGASKKLRKVKMASAVWERTISAAAFLQFKWIPAATADWSDMAKETLALEGWSSSDLFKKQRASFQRILEHWTANASSMPAAVPAVQVQAEAAGAGETPVVKQCALPVLGRSYTCMGLQVIYKLGLN